MQKNQKSLDKIDKQILRELQNDGRMSNVELSRRVNLSPTPCLERVRRLEQHGFITGYMATLDPRKLGQSLVVFVEITLDRTTPDVFDVFATAIRKLPEIEECHMVAGGFDYLAKLRVEDMYAYREFLERLSSVQGVSQTLYICRDGRSKSASGHHNPLIHHFLFIYSILILHNQAQIKQASDLRGITITRNKPHESGVRTCPKSASILISPRPMVTSLPNEWKNSNRA